MTSLTYRSDIQGLRALAVLAVIVFHYDAQLLPGGFVGVDVFLVISGYLITGILLRKKANSNGHLISTLRQFYVSRLRRIAPAYYAMLLIVSLVSAVLFIESDYSYYKNSLQMALRFVSNGYFAGFGDYFAPSLNEQPLLHTWSLAVEMQFYLLYPLVVLLLPLKWMKVVLPLCMAIFLGVTEYILRINGDTQAAYYALYTRIPEFLAGAAVAMYGWDAHPKISKAKWLWPVGLSFMFAAAFLFRSHSVFPGLASMLPVGGAVLLLMRNSRKPDSISILSHPIFVWLGALSYSLYLWHWPVLSFLRYYEGRLSLGLSATAFFIVVTLLMAIVSYYWVERAFQDNHARRHPRRPHYRYVKAALGVLMVGCLLSLPTIAQHLNKHLSPPELPIEYRSYANPETICHGAINGDCLRGDLGSKYEVLVIGDSHAAMLNSFFDVLGKELSFRARVLTGSSCVPIPQFDYLRLPKWAQDPCLKQIAEAEKYIKNADAIFLAAYWSEHLQSATFVSALESFATTLPEQKLFLISQEPVLDKNLMRVLRVQALGGKNPIQPTDTHFQANQTLSRFAAVRNNVTYLPFSEVPFFDGAPYYKNDIIYFDEHHLNEFGAKQYAYFLVHEGGELLLQAFSTPLGQGTDGLLSDKRKPRKINNIYE